MTLTPLTSLFLLFGIGLLWSSRGVPGLVVYSSTEWLRTTGGGGDDSPELQSWRSMASRSNFCTIFLTWFLFTTGESGLFLDVLDVDLPVR
uniref:Secreted protein n=1 Tax=Ixodes ricinus TaxID=34613 RepID=A0A6B0UC70_IXORI